MSIRVELYLLILFLVSLIGAFNFKKLSAPFKILTVIILITLISELIGRYLAHTIRNSNPPYPFFICIEYIGFALIYQLFFNPKSLRQVLQFSIPVFIIFCFINTLFFQGLLIFPSNILLVEHTILILFSLLLFRQMFFYPLQINILKQDVFWFNTIVLIYYASDFLIWAFHNYFLRHKLNASFIDTFSYCVNILFYIVLGLSIFLNSRKKAIVNGNN